MSKFELSKSATTATAEQAVQPSPVGVEAGIEADGAEPAGGCGFKPSFAEDVAQRGDEDAGPEHVGAMEAYDVGEDVYEDTRADPAEAEAADAADVGAGCLQAPDGDADSSGEVLGDTLRDRTRGGVLHTNGVEDRDDDGADAAAEDPPEGVESEVGQAGPACGDNEMHLQTPNSSNGGAGSRESIRADTPVSKGAGAAAPSAIAEQAIDATSEVRATEGLVPNAEGPMTSGKACHAVVFKSGAWRQVHALDAAPLPFRWGMQ